MTFDGQPGVDLPAGAQAVSDPLNFALSPGTNLTVTTYLATGQASDDITSHPGSTTASYLVAGNHLDDADLPSAVSVAHWYFLSGAEVWSKPGTAGTGC